MNLKTIEILKFFVGIRVVRIQIFMKRQKFKRAHFGVWEEQSGNYVYGKLHRVY